MHAGRHSFRIFVFVSAILFAFSISVSNAWAERRVALVIGNSAYSNQPLSNPVNDAMLMAETLRGVGFEVMEVIDADARTIRKSVHTYSRTLSRAGEEAVGFVYYAGHGIQANGENYMIPVDAEIQEAIDVEFEGFPTSTLLSALGNAGNRLNIVVMDACRNNPYKAATRSGGSGLARMDAPSGTLIAYSTAPGKVAADGRGKNSPYTRALSRAINTPGAKVEDVFKSVRVSVMDRTNDSQVPWESSSLTGDFYFLEEAPVPAAAVVPVPQPKPDNTVELTFWNSVKDSSDASLFEAYLTQYPNGLFAALAKAKIQAIGNQQAATATQYDTAFFQAIQNSNNAADFQAYLDKFPNGTFATLAQARIDALRNVAALDRSAEPDASGTDPDTDFWNAVKDSKTVAELKAYLNQFPNGKFAGLATAKIAGIEEQRQVAALTPPTSGHPYDGKWKIVWKTIGAAPWPNGPFCRLGDLAEETINIVDGKYRSRVASNLGSIATVHGTVSESGDISGFVSGRWSSGGQSYRLNVADGKGTTHFRKCGQQELTFTRLD